MARKIRIGMYMTLDGFGALPEYLDETPEWSREFWKAVWAGQLRDVDTLLLGRRTYEAWAQFWPNLVDAEDEHMRAFARFSTGVEKVVFSRTLTSAEWTNSRIVRGPLPEEFALLRSLPGKDMAVGGGQAFVQSVLAQDLEDDLYLAVSPSIIGEGNPLFRMKTNADREHIIPAGAPGRHDFRLSEARALVSGIVLLHYSRPRSTNSGGRPAGETPSG